MKTPKKLIIIASTLLFISFVRVSLAQPPPPPPEAHSATGNQDPKGAPIDGGLGILLAMGAAYGGVKLYKNRKTANKEEPNEEL